MNANLGPSWWNYRAWSKLGAFRSVARGFAVRTDEPTLDDDCHRVEPDRGGTPLRIRHSSLLQAALRSGWPTRRTRVIPPAAKFWVLEDFLPTVEIRPVDDRLDFRKGQSMARLKLDDVLTDLEFTTDRGICRLIDEAKNADFLLSFDRGFRELVVYTPPGRGDVISLEPYTQTTDAINLQARGVAAGLRILGHGAQDAFVITMETRG